VLNKTVFVVQSVIRYREVIVANSKNHKEDMNKVSAIFRGFLSNSKPCI